MYYLCPICNEIAFEKWNQLRMHLMTKHLDVKDNWPEREDAEVEEISEGVEYKEAKKRQPREKKEEIPPSGEKEPPKFVKEPPSFVPEMLSEEAGRLYNLLVIHGIPKDRAAAEANLFDQVPTYREPYNLAQRLRDKFGGQLKGSQTVILAEMFPQIPDVQYMPPMQQPTGGYFPPYHPTGYYGYPPPYNPQRYNVPYGYGIYGEPPVPREGGAKAESDKRVDKLEDMLTKFIEKKEKDDMMAQFKDSVEKLSISHKEEITRLTQKIEGMESGKGKGENEWLLRFMEERDTRFSDIITAQREQSKELTDKLAKTAEEMKKAGDEIWERAQRERALIEDTRIKERERMFSEGYAIRQRDFEERTLDIVENQLAPALIGEVKETRRAIDKLTEKIVGIPGSLPSTPSGPLSKEEGDMLASAMEAKAKMIELAKSK